MNATRVTKRADQRTARVRRLGHPAASQFWMSSRRQRTSAPSFTGRGIMPASASRRMVRAEHEHNFATAVTLRSAVSADARFPASCRTLVGAFWSDIGLPFACLASPSWQHHVARGHVETTKVNPRKRVGNSRERVLLRLLRSFLPSLFCLHRKRFKPCWRDEGTTWHPFGRAMLQRVNELHSSEF